MQILKSEPANKRTLYAFEVTYRIADERTADGEYQTRYDGLIARLKTLPGALPRRHFADAGHIATSSWIVKWTADDARALGTNLAKGLTPGKDLLEVMRVRLTDRFELTVEAPRPKAKKGSSADAG